MNSKNSASKSKFGRFAKFEAIFTPSNHWADRLSILALLFGLLLRLVHYTSNRSLWFDEASIALNLSRSYPELLSKLDYNQAAPPLFLWAEKFAVQIFGDNEYALRLFPLIAGLASVVLFYQLAKRLTTGWTTPIAIALFSSLENIAYFSSELKPYGLDATLAILVCLILSRLDHCRLTVATVLLVSLTGALGIWLSFPSIFVLASLELFNLIKLKVWTLPASQKRQMLAGRLPIYATWLISFAVLYGLIVRQALDNDSLVDSWAVRYPESPLDILWLLDSLGRFFYKPLGFVGVTDAIAMVAFVSGCVFLYRRSRPTLGLLNAPLLLTLVAAYLHQYPFRDRLLLFLAPFALLIVAEGIAGWLRCRRFYWKGLGVMMLGALVAFPLSTSVGHLLMPSRLHFDHVRPVVQCMRTQWQPGDQLYLFPEAQRQFDYYGPKYGFSLADYTVLPVPHSLARRLPDEVRSQYQQALPPFLTGQPRVWLLLAYRRPKAEATTLETIDQMAPLLERCRQPGAVASLYDFSSP
ncbi:MAG: glycosyltransferase family 39 protein [Cyanobacteria bacterium P01_F01_bin.4]